MKQQQQNGVCDGVFMVCFHCVVNIFVSTVLLVIEFKYQYVLLVNLNLYLIEFNETAECIVYVSFTAFCFDSGFWHCTVMVHSYQSNYH